MTRPRRSRVNNFNPRGWWILYIDAGLQMIMNLLMVENDDVSYMSNMSY